MDFAELISQVKHLPVINTQILSAGALKPDAIKVQISRWEKAGKLIQLKRGIYILAEPYRGIEIFEPAVASLLKRPSYISLEKALEFHNLIPEAVNVYTAVTTKRQGRFNTPVGIFDYRHIQQSLFWGYHSLEVRKQTAFMAEPEKSILDLIYFRHVDVSMDYLAELRLQNVEKINLRKLSEYARRFGKPRMEQSAAMIKDYVLAYKKKEKTL